MSVPRLIANLAFLTLNCVLAATSLAQDFERYRPLPIEPNPVVPSIPEQPVQAATGSEEILVDSLDAVIVLDHADKVVPTNAFSEARGIIRRFDRNDSIVYSRRFNEIVSRYLGRPITLRNLNQMSREIIILYRNSGQPVVDVVIPEQKITGGTIQIVIVESRVGQVVVRGGCWSNQQRLADKVACTRSGDPLYEANLKQDLWRLNHYPFRRVEVDLAPGSREGTTDVAFDVYDVFPMRSYIGYEDTGVPNLLLERVFAGVTFGDLWGLDSLLSYQFTADTEFDHLKAHSVFYQLPLDDLWTLEAYGSWAGVDPIVDVGLDQKGESWQTGFALNRQLTNTQYEQSSLDFGFDFKSTNTNVEFGGVRVFDSNAELVSLRLGYALTRRCECGEYFRLNNDLVVGPGPQFSPDNTTAAFSTVRPDTSPDFVYDRLYMERLWNLPHCWQLLARGTGQLASERLLFSETLGFGGYDTVRGYDQRTLNGDCGWIVNLELGPQPYQMGYSCRRPQQLRMFSFVDMGDAYTLNPQPGEDSQEFLISTGVGIRYNVSNRTSVRLDYGYGFNELENRPFYTNQRIHLGVVMLFGGQP